MPDVLQVGFGLLVALAVVLAVPGPATSGASVCQVCRTSPGRTRSYLGLRAVDPERAKDLTVAD